MGWRSDILEWTRWTGSRPTLRGERTTAMRRERSLQTLARDVLREDAARLVIELRRLNIGIPRKFARSATYLLACILAQASICLRY